MVIALGIHLVPFRTEKLSPTTSMVLRKSGRVDNRRFCQVERLNARKESIVRLVPFLVYKALKVNLYSYLVGYNQTKFERGR